MSIFDRAGTVFIIPYTIRQTQGKWHAQDDFEFTGYGKPAAGEYVIVAPSRSIALAYIAEANKHTDAKAEFTVIETQIVEKTVDATISLRTKN